MPSGKADKETCRHQPTHYPPRRRKCPEGRKKGLPLKAGPMVRQNVKSGRWYNFPGLRIRQAHRAACRGPIEIGHSHSAASPIRQESMSAGGYRTGACRIRISLRSKASSGSHERGPTRYLPPSWGQDPGTPLSDGNRDAPL